MDKPHETHMLAIYLTFFKGNQYKERKAAPDVDYSSLQNAAFNVAQDHVSLQNFKKAFR